MSSQFFSPKDHLDQENQRKYQAQASTPEDIATNSNDDDDNADKQRRKRKHYEGEPDVTKWVIQPAPDIVFSTSNNSDSNRVDNSKDEPSYSAAFDEESTDISMPEIKLSPHIVEHIKGLHQAQNDFERRLFDHRLRVVEEQKRQLEQLEAREIVSAIPEHERERMHSAHRLALERVDKRAIEKLDELRYTQQITLQNLGAPGFYPSSDPKVIESQMMILSRVVQ